MYDTVGIESPFISEGLAKKLENEMILKEGTDLKTGEKLYRFTNMSLMGSFDNRIQVKICRDNWVYDKNYKSPTKENCLPYIRIEGSLHKAILGHNCFGGITDIKANVAGLVYYVKCNLGIDLPDFNLWNVYRIDVSECYDLGSFDAVQEWFRGLNNATYARRKVNRYNTTGLYAPGTTTALKFYAKGAEFHKHDKKALLLSGHKKYANEIQLIANGLIRVEVEIKMKKLKSLFENCNIMNIEDNILESAYDIEVNRLLKEGKSEMKIVRESEKVKDRLYAQYGSRRAGILLGFWYMLSVQGEEKVKQQFPGSTFRRNRKYLIDAGVSWLDTNVTLIDRNMIPEDFSPVRSDIRRVIEMPERMHIQQLIYKEMVRQAV